MGGQMSSKKPVRNASHAGTWYTDDVEELREELTEYLFAKSVEVVSSPVRAVIVPHAGYAYSGPTAGHSYRQLLNRMLLPNAPAVERIFVIGPSHTAYFEGCGLSGFSGWRTPLGDLTIDTATIDKLHETRLFCTTKRQTDVREHSLEMQMPFIALCTDLYQQKRGKSASIPSIVPITVSGLSAQLVKQYGAALRPFFQDPRNFFVISSDFCHWGSHFDYMPGARGGNTATLWKTIQALDHRGIDLICKKDLGQFSEYLQETRNTICGRGPIKVLLSAVQQAQKQSKSSDEGKTRSEGSSEQAQSAGVGVRTLFYAQSSKVKSVRDSSVSYCAIAFFDQDG